MAIRATSEPIAQPRPSGERTDDLTVIPGGRGRPERVTQRRTDALAPCLEGIALAAAVITAVEKISVALATGTKYTVQDEANRLRDRAAAARDELRRMSGRLDAEGQS